jgi:hypothetical protein
VKRGISICDYLWSTYGFEVWSSRSWLQVVYEIDSSSIAPAVIRPALPDVHSQKFTRRLLTGVASAPSPGCMVKFGYRTSYMLWSNALMKRDGLANKRRRERN